MLELAIATHDVDDVDDIADLFAGAGGSSTGLKRAARDFGRRVRLTAVNHDPKALASHSENHPDATHLKVEIEDTPASVLFPELRSSTRPLRRQLARAARKSQKTARARKLKIMWASPECTEHSYAKGGASINDQRRSNAFSIPRLANDTRPDIIIVENVVPFTKWGPVEIDRYRNGRPRRDKNKNVIYRPIASRKGETFREWFAAIETCGPTYKGEWRVINAADFGEAQSRPRFFAVFTAPGIEFEWPTATHDKLGAHGRERWVGAKKFIDREIPLESIFDRSKPLSDNTLERIAAGIPLIVDDPDAAAIFQVILRRNADIASLDDVVPTVCTGGGRGGGHHAIAKVSLRRIICRNQTHNVAVTEDAPSPCLTTAHGGGVFVAEPRFLVLGQHGGGIARTNDDPISTIATDAFVRIFEPFLVKVTGTLNRESAEARVKTLAHTLGAVTTKNGVGIAQPRVTLIGKAKNTPGVIVEIDGELYAFDVGFRMLLVSELKQFQGLPADYVLIGTKADQTRQVGNAVSEKVAYALGVQAYKALGYTIASERIAA